MENLSRTTQNFIFSLPSVIGAPASAWLTNGWVAIAVVLINVCILGGFKVAHHAWIAFGPGITARFTHRVWLKIDPAEATKMAKYDHMRMRERSHPEVNTNSPPELPSTE